MADGYARVSGRPGVAFVITGPGLTNTLTPMAQARSNSVPMLVVSGVNVDRTLGKGKDKGKGHGHLHELPDQLATALASAFAPFTDARPGPTHIEIPLDPDGHCA